MATVATFNCEWRKTASKDAALIRERLLAIDPDIVCLTEAYTDHFGDEGHTIFSRPSIFEARFPGRRKVVLWSRNPWKSVDDFGCEDIPEGRFVCGETETRIGKLSVTGVCIPYAQAGVRFAEPKRKLWEQHERYLGAIGRCIPKTSAPTVVLGDFNQRVPPGKQPARVYQALEAVLLRDFRPVTGGVLQPIGLPSIDHICVSQGLAALAVSTISNVDPAGRKISDHFGVAARITRSPHG